VVEEEMVERMGEMEQERVGAWEGVLTLEEQDKVMLALVERQDLERSQEIPLERVKVVMQGQGRPMA